MSAAKCTRCGNCCRYVSCGLAEEYGMVQTGPYCPALNWTGPGLIVNTETGERTRIGETKAVCGLLLRLKGNDLRRVKRLLRIGKGCCFGPTEETR